MSQPEGSSKAISGILEMLDNVSACAQNMLLAHGHLMSAEDQRNRSRIITEARDFCDAHLRSDDSEEDDE